MKKITLLGSTGSIGTQTLKVVDRNSDKFTVTGITGNRNIELLENQIRKYKLILKKQKKKMVFPLAG